MLASAGIVRSAGTDYYANWLIKARHQQIRQFPDRHKVYLHLLCFIKYQFFRRQDHGVDIVLKSVKNARAYVRRHLREQHQADANARSEAIEALRKAQLTDSDIERFRTT